MKNRMFYKKTERYTSKIQKFLQTKPLYKKKTDWLYFVLFRHTFVKL